MVSFGDGFHIVSDPRDPDVFLSEFQGGGLFRTDMKVRDQIAASPQPRRGDGGPVGDLEFRFNWNAPIIASPHDGRTVYFGGNVVFRTDESRALQRLVGAGVGHALVPLMSVDAPVPGMVIVDASRRVPPRRIGIAWHRDVTLPEAAQSFLDAVVERCSDVQRELDARVAGTAAA